MSDLLDSCNLRDDLPPWPDDALLLNDFDLMSDGLLDESFVRQMLTGDEGSAFLSDAQHQHQHQHQHYQQYQSHSVKAEPKANVLESLLKNPAPGPIVTPAPAARLIDAPPPPASSDSRSATDNLIAILLRQRQEANRREHLVELLVQQVAKGAGGPSDEKQLAAAFRELPTAQLEQLAAGGDGLQLLIGGSGQQQQQQQQQQRFVVQHQHQQQHQQPPQTQPSVASVVVGGNVSSVCRAQEDEEEEDDLMDEEKFDVDSVSGGVGGGQRGVRKSSHNVIEKRYRLSINDKIDELRKMLVGKDGKLSKSSVLRRAIDRIRQLERENVRLRQELQQQQQQQMAKDGAGRIDPSVSNGSPASYEDAGSSSESPSSLPSPSGSSNSSSELTTHQHQHQHQHQHRKSTLVQLLESRNVDGGGGGGGFRFKIGLAAFCFFFFLNPLQYAFFNFADNSNVGVVGGARTLKSAENLSDSGGFWPITIAHWCILMLIGYKYLLPDTVAGVDNEEPKCRRRRLAAFVECSLAVDADLNRGDWRSGCRRIGACLLLLKRRLPQGEAAWFVQFCWQSALACFLRVCPPLAVSGERRQLAGLASVTYWRLLQLIDCSLAGDVRPYHTLTLLLNCWNFYDLAGDSGLSGSVPVEQRVRLLSELGLTSRVCLPNWLGKRVAKYFYNRAFALLESANRDEASSAASSASLASLAWLSTEQGFAFLCEYRPGLACPSHLADDTGYSTPGRVWRPLDSARATFAESLLEVALEALVSGDSQRLAESENFLRLCADLFGQSDSASAWWAEAVGLAGEWRMGRSTTVGLRRPEGGGGGVEFGDSSLACCLQLAAAARRRGLLGNAVAMEMCGNAAVKAADEASAGFRSMMIDRETRWMTQAWCLIGTDWLLTARAALGAGGRRELSKFQDDLSLMRLAVARTGASPRQWLVAHEATLRLLCNANPLATGVCLRQAHPSSERRLQMARRMLAEQVTGGGGRPDGRENRG